MPPAMNTSSLKKSTVQHQRYQDAIALFDCVFAETQNTRLIKGGHEPEYLPATKEVPYHQVIFAHGYFASALHEIAHWCIAGASRRLLADYGYWYCPDGRDYEQQKQFEQVEIKPQAIEWAFSIAANKAFRVSTDNLNGAEPDTLAFTLNVQRQAVAFLELGFPPRAQLFINALQGFYATDKLCSHDFNLPADIDKYSPVSLCENL